MNPYFLPKENVDYLDDLLLSNGLLKVVPASVLSNVSQIHLSIWGNQKGIYCFPTVELIDWLKEQVAGRNAIEICSGTGVIGRSMGIISTDSYVQTSPQMILLYELYGQKPISPPEDVFKFEANEAVDHFKPSVVLGSYITQKYLPGDEGDENNPKIGSSIYGVDELSLLNKVDTYIAIGNHSTHGDKRIRKFKHTSHQFPWLFTRSVKPNENEISVWNKQ